VGPQARNTCGERLVRKRAAHAEGSDCRWKSVAARLARAEHSLVNVVPKRSCPMDETTNSFVPSFRCPTVKSSRWVEGVVTTTRTS
jgi:hypothetical protein